MHSRNFRRASLRSELTFLPDRGRILSIQNSSFSSLTLLAFNPLKLCIPKAAGSVGQGGLPLQMARLAALLPPVARSLPAGVRNDHLVGEGVQGVVHDLHLYRVVGREVPQCAWDEIINLVTLTAMKKNKIVRGPSNN